jgi:hypothetical protein
MTEGTWIWSLSGRSAWTCGSLLGKNERVPPKRRALPTSPMVPEDQITLWLAVASKCLSPRQWTTFPPKEPLIVSMSPGVRRRVGDAHKQQMMRLSTSCGGQNGN